MCTATVDLQHGKVSVTIFIRSLWRNLQWEGLLVEESTDELALGRVVGDWFNYYNRDSIHQALGYDVSDERW